MHKKTIVFAHGAIGCIGIKSLLNAGYEIEAVFTHKINCDEISYIADVSHLSASLNIPTYAPEEINSPKWVSYIEQLKPSYIFSFYYRKKIPMAIIKQASLGAFNLHGSLLPKYRGCAPINWAIIKGETETGITLHELTDKFDAGDIIAQQKIPIDHSDTAYKLFEKVCIASDLLLSKILVRILSENYTRTPQGTSLATYYPRRKPSDGLIDWHKKTIDIYNLIRGVSKPYPGAFTYYNDSKFKVWSASIINPAEFTENNNVSKIDEMTPGSVISISPFVIKTADGLLEILTGEIEGSSENQTEFRGITLMGMHLANQLNLKKFERLTSNLAIENKNTQTKTVLILGVNGFIGHHLASRLIQIGTYNVIGVDIANSKVCNLMSHKNFEFQKIDILINHQQIESLIKWADIVLPLVAIATPVAYTKRPLDVFELDFEANLKIVHLCAKYHKRIIFPSTSEVYGMCNDEEFNEVSSNFVLGPIHKQRWIYSASKQLLDRIIYAYGTHKKLSFTLFRPFNWVGEGLDTLALAKLGHARVLTQMIGNLINGEFISLVEGGKQKRCFTDIKDGITALVKIVENDGNRCDNQIINIGNPENEFSIEALAVLVIDKFRNHPLSKHFPEPKGTQQINKENLYGTGYQDVEFRKPSIKIATETLGWRPSVKLEETINNTLDSLLNEALLDRGLINI